jgi:hypothetical protein
VAACFASDSTHTSTSSALIDRSIDRSEQNILLTEHIDCWQRVLCRMWARCTQLSSSLGCAQARVSGRVRSECRRPQWPRSSPAPKLRSWVRIPLQAWMLVCVYSVFVLSCV